MKLLLTVGLFCWQYLYIGDFDDSTQSFSITTAPDGEVDMCALTFQLHKQQQFEAGSIHENGTLTVREMLIDWKDQYYQEATTSEILRNMSFPHGFGGNPLCAYWIPAYNRGDDRHLCNIGDYWYCLEITHGVKIKSACQ